MLKRKLFQINDSTISKKVKSPWTKKEGELLIGNFRNSESEVVTKTKIAAFDLDHTLTKTKGKHVFHKNADDWEFLYSNVPFKLKKLVEEGHEIVLFSNQTGLEKDGKETSKMKVFKDKVEKVAMALGVDFVIFASLGYGKYRKPLPGMFYEYQELFYNNPEPVDTTNSFFVGDAAGRSYGEIKGKAKKDFSDTDLKFALNLNMCFKTPEQFFLNKNFGKDTIVKEIFDFDPKQLVLDEKPLFLPSNTPLFSDQDILELVIFTGFPGSGKSNFFKKYFESRGYFHCNQDELKSKSKCLQECKRVLSLKQSCVVDNTNPEESTRKQYISIAKVLDIPVRCFYFNSSMELSQHNNIFRSINLNTPRVPTMVYHVFKNKFKEPTLDEGYQEIKVINFLPEFENDDLKKNWLLYHL
ncbi:hypothetical protein HK099_001225 [Clydaea vesicula]|uniref:Bifunctional polynucleotide phosphatase/kinase n=1 Tax=Clydaea vesicula TaxID=447962 RepID=A0AAD5TWK4_9FUNG|nr:hypothetical protein HK099_001225 [Clydaea vesicula]